MSPSEADLRAALREGEGDGVDPDDIIWSVRHARARRRSMLLSAAAAVVVVAATAAGVTALVHGAGSPNSSNGAAAGATMNGGNAATGSQSATGSRSATGSQSTAGKQPSKPGLGREPGMQLAPICPAQQGSGGSVPRADASGSLLAGPAKAFFVCAYSTAGARPSAVSQWVRVTGQPARQLNESLQNLPASAPPNCPKATSTGNLGLRIVPIGPTGQGQPPIIAKIGLPSCATTVTNGSVLRYDWQLPPSVERLLSLNKNGSGSFRLSPPMRGESGTPPR